MIICKPTKLSKVTFAIKLPSELVEAINPIGTQKEENMSPFQFDENSPFSDMFNGIWL